MAKFRKKPVVIEAIQRTQNDGAELFVFMYPDGPVYVEQKDGDPENPVGINTLEGLMTARVGDWIIKGWKGEFYPCKPDIFAATYEPVE